MKNSNIHKSYVITQTITATKIAQLWQHEKQLFWLDSSKQDQRLGNTSMIARTPLASFEANHKDDNSVDILTKWQTWLDTITSNVQYEDQKISPPGVFGFFGYDFKDNIQKHQIKQTAKQSLSFPDIYFALCQEIIVIDHAKNNVTHHVIAKDDHKCDTLHQALLNNISSTVETLQATLLRDGISVRNNNYCSQQDNPLIHFHSPRASYGKQFQTIQQQIKEGNTYEVNLTHRIDMNISGDPLEMYLDMRDASPAPHACFIKKNKDYVLCSSPERLFQIKDKTIELRPIKGTRPRGKTSIEDQQLKEELRNSIKDQAENLMITDLIRNDIGRISEIGSVSVPELLHIERYAHVFQMVSTVTGKLMSDIKTKDIIQAIFPGGSMTGAPKLRTIKIIEEVESTMRNLYAGSIGHISLDQKYMDFNIVIRTALLMHKKNTTYIASINVGGAIVSDSLEKEEWEESLLKGQNLIDTLSKYQA